MPDHKQQSHSNSTAPMYENILMPDCELPINVNLRKNSARTGGCELHWHEELEFYYVKKGGLCLLCSGESQSLYPGDVGFVNWCGLHRSNQFLDGTEHYIIQIGTKLFEEETVSYELADHSGRHRENMLLCFISHPMPMVVRNCPELNELLDMIIFESQRKLPGYEIKIKAAVFQILVLLLRRSERPPHPTASGVRDVSALKRVREILAYLSFHCTKPEEVTLPALSQRFGLSVPYLCKIFKRCTSLTVTTYINELRCTRAAACIREGVALEEVAVRTGFRDYNYFSRVFTKIQGIAPSEYRRRQTDSISNAEQNV